jgi:TPR repeat protein
MNEIDVIREKLKKSLKGEDLYDLAQCYDSINQFGNPNPYFNNFRRLYWYLKAGIYSNSEAYNNVGFIIEHELNIKNKNSRALEYYKKSFELGSKLGKENYFLSLKQFEK